MKTLLCSGTCGFLGLSFLHNYYSLLGLCWTDPPSPCQTPSYLSALLFFFPSLLFYYPQFYVTKVAPIGSFCWIPGTTHVLRNPMLRAALAELALVLGSGFFFSPPVICPTKQWLKPAANRSPYSFLRIIPCAVCYSLLIVPTVILCTGHSAVIPCFFIACMPHFSIKMYSLNKIELNFTEMLGAIRGIPKI